MDKLHHNISSTNVIKILDSDLEKGLNKEEVSRRILSFGKNIFKEKKETSKIILFLNQFKSPLMYVLIFAGILTLFIKNYTDATVIFLALIISALFGFFEEDKVSNVLKNLKNALKTKTTVLRDGSLKEIYQEDLVIGDIILLKAGQKIPADARIIEANNLRVSEAMLTGEWLAEEKIPDVLAKETPLADRKNMVYMSPPI